MLSTSKLVSEIRRRSGSTQEALAHRIGVSFPTVNAWERGRSTPRPALRRRLEELAEELGIVHARTILVIDDDPSTGELVAAAAREVDDSIGVEVALDGWEGLIMCGSLKPDMIFLDILMPGIDGIEVARKLPHVGLDDPAVVFVTSSQDSAVLDRAREVGHPIASKPLDVDAVAATISDQLGIADV